MDFNGVKLFFLKLSQNFVHFDNKYCRPRTSHTKVCSGGDGRGKRNGRGGDGRGGGRGKGTDEGVTAGAALHPSL